MIPLQSLGGKRPRGHRIPAVAVESASWGGGVLQAPAPLLGRTQSQGGVSFQVAEKTVPVRLQEGDVATVEGNDDFASMREVIGRRYTRLRQEGQPMPSLVLVDGGLGQLHAAAQALEAAGILNQPLASIAKREEWIYVLGQEDEPVKLDRFSPVLHLVQSVRDEAHRFAVTFHRARRGKAMLGARGPKR